MWANCLSSFWKLCSTPSYLPCSLSIINEPLNGVQWLNLPLATEATLRLRTYRFEVTVAETRCHHTFIGFFSFIPSLDVSQTVLPVVELFFYCWGKTYTMTDGIDLPSVVFSNNTFLGLRFFTPDFSIVEGENSADEACFVYDLIQGEGSGDVRYFRCDCQSKLTVAQVGD